MKMEKSLIYAIAKAKRNIMNNKYSKLENILDAMYQYSIRTDEVETMMKSINKWLAKEKFLYEKEYTESDIKSLIKCA